MQNYRIVFKPLPSYIYEHESENLKQAEIDAFNRFYEDFEPEVEYVKEI